MSDTRIALLVVAAYAALTWGVTYLPYQFLVEWAGVPYLSEIRTTWAFAITLFAVVALYAPNWCFGITAAILAASACIGWNLESIPADTATRHFLVSTAWCTPVLLPFFFANAARIVRGY